MSDPSDTRYASPSEAEIARLVSENPLAWIVSGIGERFRATLLPLRAVTDDAGRIVRLDGHFARRNAQLIDLQGDDSARILFLGPHGYISPSWMRDRQRAPTWNYASAQFSVRIEFLADQSLLLDAMHDLVSAMEGGRRNAWDLTEMRERYESLSRAIVGFRAHVLERRVKFKLGQDERDDVYADIMEALSQETESESLRHWMSRSNPTRSADGTS